MVVQIDSTTQALLINQKLYLVTSLQTFLLKPRSQQAHYYNLLVLQILESKYSSVPEIMTLCNNKIDLISITGSLIKD
jgi:hypothetical protein